MKKVKVVGWIIEAELSDGRVVTLDVSDAAAQMVDDDLSLMEKKGIDSYVIESRKTRKKVKEVEYGEST